MIDDRTYRSGLITRYLEAGTTVEEEIALAEYYAGLCSGESGTGWEKAVLAGKLDAEEAAVARMILDDHPEAAVTSDEGAAEFDSIAGCMADCTEKPTANCSGNRKRHLRPAVRRTLFPAASFAIAAITLLLVVIQHRQNVTECMFTPLEIAQNIDTLFNMDTDDIESIVAEPKGANVILIAKMKDGSSNTFIMSRNPDDGSTRILAQNNVRSKKK